MTLYFEPKFQQISLSWSCALHTAVSFLSRGKIRKACLRGFPLDIPSTKWNIATFSGATTRNFDLAETVTLSNSTKLSENGATRHSQGQCVGTLYIEKLKHCPVSSKPSENGATRHSQGQRHKNFVLAETITLLKFHKTFGEWSIATFSGAMRRNFIYSQTETLPIMAARS